MTTLRALVLAAVFVVIGFLLLILSCTAVSNKSAWPLLSFIFLFATPLPFILCTSTRESLYAENTLNSFGHFAGGALGVSGPAMAFVLYHTGVITLPAAFLSLAAQAFFAAAMLVLKFAFSSDTDYYDG